MNLLYRKTVMNMMTRLVKEIRTDENLKYRVVNFSDLKLTKKHRL